MGSFFHRLKKPDLINRQTKIINYKEKVIRNKELMRIFLQRRLTLLRYYVKQQQAPDVDLDAFDANSFEYHYLMILFQELEEKKFEDPNLRLTHLIKYTKSD